MKYSVEIGSGYEYQVSGIQMLIGGYTDTQYGEHLNLFFSSK
jgi:hypothetical protein